MARGLQAGTPVFVDTGAWIALAIGSDPLHAPAAAAWSRIQSRGLRIVTETFTFLERNTRLDVALSWKDRLRAISRLVLLECTTRDLTASWDYFRRRDLHKLSAVDATSFVLMKREGIRLAFSFDHHFATAGFRMVD
jgi:predicted nucleic acid-binding protein